MRKNMLLLLFLLLVMSGVAQTKEDLDSYQSYIEKETKEIESLPDNYRKAETYSTRSSFYLLANDFEHALSDADSYLKMMSYVEVTDYVRQIATAGAHTKKAQIYLRQKDFDMAAYELKLAISIKDDQVGIYSLRSDMYVFLGNYRSALADIKTWVNIQNERETDYTRAVPFGKLVLLYITQQDLENAQKYFIIFRGHKGSSDRVFTFDDTELINIFKLVGEKNYDIALEQTQKILKDNTRGKATEKVENINRYYAELLLAAYIAEAKGNFDLAVSYCKKAQVINPKPQNVEQVLQRLRLKINERNSLDKTAPSIQVLKTYGAAAGAAGSNHYVQLLGKASDEGGISWVKVNNQPVKKLESDGFFMYDGNVSGDNIMVEAADKNGNIVRKEVAVSISSTQDPEKIRNRYHAVIIACERYGTNGLPTIHTIGQAERFRQLLESKYGFDRSNTITVFNATYEDIVRELSKKMESLGTTDNLVIYFAGHGKFADTDKGRVGYWVPSNAKNDQEYISSNKLNTLLDSCKARQILVISDACFSVSMAGEEKTSQLQMDMSLSSRQILTSGSLEGVPDRSVFIDAIIDALTNNNLSTLPAIRLHSRIVEPVMDKTGKTPLLLHCGSGGDMGGQFQFRQNIQN